MLPGFLIVFLSIFVLYSLRFMVKRHDYLHAIAFLFLYIYTVFAQIGYAYFPELSMFYGAYFGPFLFYKYWAFMFLSFLSTFLVYRLLTRFNIKSAAYRVKKLSVSYFHYFFYAIVFFLLIVLNVYFYVNRGLFGYGGGTPMGGSLFGLGFIFFQTCTFILYTLFRDELNRKIKRLFSLLLFSICILFYVQVVFTSGTRSPILYFFLALVAYEFFPLNLKDKYYRRKLLVFSFVGLGVFTSLNLLRSIRLSGEMINMSSFINYNSDDSEFADQDISALVLAQDYYVPSHTLFVSMQYNIIDPLEVLRSNFFNALVKFKYPFFTTKITQRVTGSTDERGVGWAYHYFVEGYNAFGFFGFFYNAIFWNLGVTLWVKLGCSNDWRHNKVMLSLSTLVVVMVMKSQTSAFIQFYWLVLLPALGLLLLANNAKIVLIRSVNLE
jgi:hypothetical protein